jgi:tRNA(Ile)-lysidine synthase
MINNFIAFLHTQCTYQQGQRILVALSGGADSMALLHLLHRCNVEICAAHCNFNLRGEESDGDEYFVKKVVKDLGIDLYHKSFDTKQYAQEKKISIEMAARDLRYEWFNELCKEKEMAWIATGHHKDDNIETFFLNLVRGTGIKGLSGIKPVAGNIIRPLLPFSRQEIEAFCTKNHISFRTDSSNLESVYQRNKLRNVILPLFKELNPMFYDTMDANIKRLDQVNSFLIQSVEDIKQQLIVEQDDRLLISLQHIEKFKDQQLVLFELLQPYGFNGKQITELVQVIREGISGKQFFSAQYRLIKDRVNLILLPHHRQPDECIYYISVDDAKLSNPVDLHIYPDLAMEGYEIEKSPLVGQFDADLLEFPLTLRKWKQGDQFRPLGMKSFKKLSDFFIDAKFSLKDKEDVWLLLSGDDIIWIVGYRTDDRYKITSKTRRVTKMDLCL